jgi:hypothetical protein
MQYGVYPHALGQKQPKATQPTCTTTRKFYSSGITMAYSRIIKFRNEFTNSRVHIMILAYMQVNNRSAPDWVARHILGISHLISPTNAACYVHTPSDTPETRAHLGKPTRI